MTITLMNKDEKVYEKQNATFDFSSTGQIQSTDIPLDKVYEKVPNGGVLTL